MRILKSGAVLALSVMLAVPALAQNSTRNVGPSNIGVNPNPNPYPQPCRYNCYGGGNQGEVIGGFVGGLIGGIIAGSSARRNQNRQFQNQPVSQQPIQPQVQPRQVQVGQAGQFSAQHYQYCQNRFKSYVLQTNTYTSFSGQTRYCNSPYN